MENLHVFDDPFVIGLAILGIFGAGYGAAQLPRLVKWLTLADYEEAKRTAIRNAPGRLS